MPLPTSDPQNGNRARKKLQPGRRLDSGHPDYGGHHLAHQRPQDAQVRPLHHARVARVEAQSSATQPAAHIGLPGPAHGGSGSAGPRRGASLTSARVG